MCKEDSATWRQETKEKNRQTRLMKRDAACSVRNWLERGCTGCWRYSQSVEYLENFRSSGTLVRVRLPTLVDEILEGGFGAGWHDCLLKKRSELRIAPTI